MGQLLPQWVPAAWVRWATPWGRPGPPENTRSAGSVRLGVPSLPRCHQPRTQQSKQALLIRHAGWWPPGSHSHPLPRDLHKHGRPHRRDDALASGNFVAQELAGDRDPEQNSCDQELNLEWMEPCAP